MSELGAFLQPARYPGESVIEYRARRKAGNTGVKRQLFGTYAHISAENVTLPPAGKDEKVDEAIRLRQYRDVTETLNAKQQPIRIARTKGVTYRRPHSGQPV